MQSGIQVYAHIHKIFHCPGWGCCGSCRVLITKGQGHASIMGPWEKMRFTIIPDHIPLAFIGNEDTMRLSCRTEVHGDMDVVTKPPLNWFGENFFS